ncbi:TetR/AcrR family transcriptional regulator [Mycobacterium colombiense]|uniref:TetR/AcrR family transcriptional regulator n=1 Tax=Mycobacterium colombiense TaxID=339268 RepID=UPI00200B4C46|nr:TetR/AcrR family transcriptional regulator [Mycobacterium colombiense]MCK8642406.1 TetR/AcrR family transcriptional regulator [Mycobacterium colombiense]
MTRPAPIPRTRKPAAVRREEILQAAAVEFAETGLAGTRLEAIAARAGISHPRIVQMFGSKRALFLEVVQVVFDRIAWTFGEVADRPATGIESTSLVAMGDAYRRLLQRDRTTSLMMLQSYAAASDSTVREAVARHYLALQRKISDLTGADILQVRTFFATGFIVTVSTALGLPGKRTDTTWAGWLLKLTDSNGL